MTKRLMWLPCKMGTQLLTGRVKEEETEALIETKESKRFDLGKATIKDAFEPVDDQECLSNTAETSGGSLRQLSI